MIYHLIPSSGAYPDPLSLASSQLLLLFIFLFIFVLSFYFILTKLKIKIEDQNKRNIEEIKMEEVINFLNLRQKEKEENEQNKGKEEKQVLHLVVEDREERSKIHEYVKKNYGKDYISRSLYMAHGTEIKCCDVWYKTTEYGKGWNGGYIFCEKCGNITYAHYDDYEDALHEEGIRFSLFRPTGEMIICKKTYPYKNLSRSRIFSYRKRY